MLKRWRETRLARAVACGGFAPACVYAVACAVAAAWILRDAIAGKLISALSRGTGDCVVNWLGARAFERGIDPYSAAGLEWAGIPALGHPPTTPLWYLPFTAYGIVELNQVFGLLLIVILFVHVVLLAEELRTPVPMATALLAFALVMDTTWWQQHIINIQLSEPIAFAYVLAWMCFRRGHVVASGVAIGLAMTLKPFAGLLVVMLLVVRCWPALIAALSTYAIAALVATWRFGIGCWGEFVRALPETQAKWTANLHNASVLGIVARWWRPACVEPGTVGWHASAVALLFDVAVVALVVWGTRRAAATARSRWMSNEDIDLPFALFVIAAAWLNPVVWEHYRVMLLQPIAVATMYTVALARQRGFRLAAIPGAAIVASVLLLGVDTVAREQSHHHAALHLHEVANWLPWPLLLAACTMLLISRPTVQPRAEVQPA